VGAGDEFRVHVERRDVGAEPACRQAEKSAAAAGIEKPPLVQVLDSQQ
jgi:hypothetical protein